MATTRAQQKAETRRRILEAASDLFAENGYEGTTTRQIAEHCDISIGAVFAHFANKQMLLKAVLFEEVERALAWARGRLGSGADVGEAMVAFAGSLYRFYVQRRELSRELIRHSLFGEEELMNQLQLFREELRAFVPAVLNAEQTARETEAVVDALLSHYFFMLLVLLNDDEMSVARALKRLRRMNALVLA